MQRILITLIGRDDPTMEDPASERRINGPILELVGELKPDQLVLLVTSADDGVLDPTEEAGKRTGREITRRFPDIEIRSVPLTVFDSTDFEELLMEMKQAVEGLVREYRELEGDDVEFSVCLSSGTPQVQAVWITLRNAEVIPAALFQVRVPGTVPEGSSRIRPVQPYFLEEEKKLHRARNYLFNSSFRAAERELLELAKATSDAVRGSRANELARLASVLERVDQADYRTAYRTLSDLDEELAPHSARSPELAELRTGLQPLLSTLSILIGEGIHESRLGLIDLYHNARRRYHRGEYIEVMNRFRRFCQGCLYFRLRETMVEAKPEKLNFDQSLDRLRKANDEVIERLDKNPRLLKQLTTMTVHRETSLAGRGMGTVERSRAEGALGLMSRLLRTLFPDLNQAALNNYPFSMSSIAGLADSISVV
ncbi:hypothetical protein ACFLT7_06970 [candidate division KSB1 bacterium]